MDPRGRQWYAAAGIAAALAMHGCAPIAATAFGVGASTGVSHTLTGITYRTFTAPSSKVKSATYAAFNRMAIKPVSTSRVDGNEVIKASASGREIEVELEPLSPNTTRMRVVAKSGLFYDSATATEIILQTEKVLDRTLASKGG